MKEFFLLLKKPEKMELYLGVSSSRGKGTFPGFDINPENMMELFRVSFFNLHCNVRSFLESYIVITSLGTGLQADSDYQRWVAVFSKKDVDQCKILVNVIFSDKKGNVLVCKCLT